MKYKRPLIITCIMAVLYILFLFWYGGSSSPVTQNEIDLMIAKIQKSAGKEGQPEREMLKIFRELCKNDDGKEFYMVNLMKFRKKALYPDGYKFSDDSREAAYRYNAELMPYLLKLGGHPVYAGEVIGRFIHPDGADDWDQTAVVRYRSRRDLLAMAADLAAKNIDVHKWAALEKTHVFPVKPVFSLFMARSIAAGFFIFIGYLINKIMGYLNRGD